MLNQIKSSNEELIHNQQLFDIFEGNLLEYILSDLRDQLSLQSYNQIKSRVAPINVLKKIIDKLSKIYAKDPKRIIENPRDEELYNFYFKTMRPTVEFNSSNEFFNLFKSTWVEPYIDNGKPKMRALPADKFRVFSFDQVNPLKPTHLVKFMGEGFKIMPNGEIKKVKKFHWYSDEEFIITDDEGNVLREDMALVGNPEGINSYGTLPGVYINRSRYQLIPCIDTDILRMTKLLPILLSDLNYAVMFQSFSIIYGIDVNDENLTMSPNAFWRFKSDHTGMADTSPQIGVIKPQVDITQVTDFIKFQLSFWLNTKNIRPGSIGDMTIENSASGISKMIDEMDTSEDRQKQVPIFEDAEEEFWRKLAHNFHPAWVQSGEIDINMYFSPNAEVSVEFPEQAPLVTRKDLIEEQKAELDAGFTSKRRAIKRLNPDMSEQEIDELLAEIDEEHTIEVEAKPVLPPQMPQLGQGQMPTAEDMSNPEEAPVEQ